MTGLWNSVIDGYDKEEIKMVWGGDHWWEDNYVPEPPPTREELFNDRFFAEEARPDYDELMERDDNEVTEEDVDAEEWGAWLKDGERPVANYDGQR